MNRKNLPKTPQTLFDSVVPEKDKNNNQQFQKQNSRKNSQSPTPTKSKSRSPTPKKTSNFNSNSRYFVIKLLRSNVTFCLSSILTILLFLTLTKDLISFKYCDSDMDLKNLDMDFGECIPCPQNAKCSFGKYICNEDAYQFKGECITIGTDEYEAIQLYPKIEEIIRLNSINSLTDLLNTTDVLNVKFRIIKLAFELSDKYMLIGDRIEERWTNETTQFMLYCSLTFCLILFVLSILTKYQL